MAVIKTIVIPPSAIYGEPLEVDITEGPVNFRISEVGFVNVSPSSTSDIRELAKALVIWADWQDMRDK